MQRRTFFAAPVMLSVTAALPRASHAQPAQRVARVGWVTVRSGVTAGALEAFRAGLADRGWIEGRNLELVLRDGEGLDARRLYDELLRAKVDVIAASGSLGLSMGLLAQDVPVAFVVGGDPVEAGLVSSLARPQANRTGMTLLSYELVGKRVELLTQVMPGLQRVGYLYYGHHPGARQEVRRAQEACEQLRLTLHALPLNGNVDVEPALLTVQREGVQGIVTAVDGVIARHAARIAAFGLQRGVPAASGWAGHVQDGFLFSYGANVRSFYHYLAGYVDRMLRGARPGDLPVELPPTTELVVNRVSLRRLGITLPAAVAARVDEFIDGTG